MNNRLIFVEFLRDESGSNDVFLVIGQIQKESDAIQTSSVLAVIPDNNFFDSLTEGLSINDPKTAGLSCCHAGISLGIVQ